MEVLAWLVRRENTRISTALFRVDCVRGVRTQQRRAVLWLATNVPRIPFQGLEATTSPIAPATKATQDLKEVRAWLVRWVRSRISTVLRSVLTVLLAHLQITLAYHFAISVLQEHILMQELKIVPNAQRTLSLYQQVQIRQAVIATQATS
jgi:hypothetical protein